MVSLAMAVVVLSSTGGLLMERVPAAGLLVGAIDLNVEASTYDTMSIAELQLERARLMETMPALGLGLGIGLTVVGGGVLVTGLILLGLAYFEMEFVVALIVLGAAVPLLIIGPILLVAALRERREVQAQVGMVDQRMAQRRRDEFPPPTQTDSVPDEVPPPPPVRPPGSELTPWVEPQLLLATF